jgi:hypothetical protein
VGAGDLDGHGLTGEAGSWLRDQRRGDCAGRGLASVAFAPVVAVVVAVRSTSCYAA